MTEFYSASSSVSPFTAILWCLYPVAVLVIIEGQAKITTQNGAIYVIKAGDLVEFPAVLNCEWEVTKSIKKHYRLGS